MMDPLETEMEEHMGIKQLSTHTDCSGVNRRKFSNVGADHDHTLNKAPYCCCLVAQLCPTLFDPKGCSPPGFSVHGISQVRILEWVDPGIEPGSPAFQADSLLTEPAHGGS